MAKAKQGKKSLFAWVSKDVHTKLKVRAAQASQTMEEYLESILIDHFKKVS